MAFVKFDHIGIAVKEIEEALKLFTEGLGFQTSGEIRDFPELKFKNAWVKVGEEYPIELLESTDPNSDIGRFVAKQGEGLFHICIEVDDIEAQIKALKGRGVDVFEAPPTSRTPYKRGFIRRKDAKGALIELVPQQRKKER